MKQKSVSVSPLAVSNNLSPKTEAAVKSPTPKEAPLLTEPPPSNSISAKRKRQEEEEDEQNNVVTPHPPSKKKRNSSGGKNSYETSTAVAKGLVKKNKVYCVCKTKYDPTK